MLLPGPSGGIGERLAATTEKPHFGSGKPGCRAVGALGPLAARPLTDRLESGRGRPALSYRSAIELSESGVHDERRV
jgi:hypothetical protein